MRITVPSGGPDRPGTGRVVVMIATLQRRSRGWVVLGAALLAAVAWPRSAAALFGRDRADAVQVLSAGKPYTADLGQGVRIEFVWIEVLGGWASRFEITNAQYRRYQPKHLSGTYARVSLDGPDQPAVNVPYEEGREGAAPFARWLTERERISRRVAPGYVFRVPTSAEWSELARCGRDIRFPWGDTWPPAYGNYADWAARKIFGENQVLADYEDGFAVTAPVGQSGENPWGLFGISGNVWEWTHEPGQGLGRVRGGSWLDRSPDFLAIHGGYSLPLRYRFEGLGFRLVLMPDNEEQP